MPSNQPAKQYPFIKISGRSFSEGIEFKTHEAIFSKTEGTVRIDLNINPEFRNVDFKDHIEIYFNEKTRYIGIVKNYQFNDKIGIINFEDETLRLENETFSAEFLDMKPVERMDVIAQSSGFILNPNSRCQIDAERNFFIIIPILNFETKDCFRIGNVKFYQKFDDLDDSIIKDSNTGKKNLFWIDCSVRAKIKIKAINFFEAISKGYEKISQAIDIIALRTDLSFPSMTINSHYQNFPFNYYHLLSKVKIPTTIYCREISSHAALFYDVESISEKRLSLDEKPIKFFDDLILLCNDLIVKKEPTQEEENLLQVLHWLRKAMQEGDRKDKFLDLWIAFDFLISGESAETLFTDDEKEKLKKIIRFDEFNEKQKSTIVSKINMLDDSIFTDDEREKLKKIVLSDEFSERQKSAIVSKINMLNDSPLMERFSQLIQNLEISFSTDEISALQKMRRKRTDIIHGIRDISITDGELSKMRTILEKMFIGKISKSSIGE
ncbi:hypothetical protein [Methanoregula sp.]|uniref:hypothetical protein n=1 Tax=Methanoregula sp. TaxID=2052170 RepID=UPI0023740CD9|nr:hypothetical protein [Methanoregula sp.]MDD1685896.1 hypothetical protein [Methanoregula sp.]